MGNRRRRRKFWGIGEPKNRRNGESGNGESGNGNKNNEEQEIKRKLSQKKVFEVSEKLTMTEIGEIGE